MVEFTHDLDMSEEKAEFVNNGKIRTETFVPLEVRLPQERPEFAAPLKKLQELMGAEKFSRRISRLQNIQFMLADMETEIEKARWVVYYPAARLDRGASPREIGKHSARAKAVGAEVAAEVTRKAIQILGGCGVNPEYRLAGLLNDAMELFPATGTVEIMKVIQATEIINRLRH